MSENHGHRLIIPLIEHKASTNPSGLYCTLPTSPSSLSASPIRITWRALARSIDRASWWLDAVLGAPAPKTFPTLAFVGLNGPLYYILCAACIKTGHKLLLASPRNPVAAQLHLLDATHCSVLLRGPRSNLVQGILEARGGLRCITVPDLDELLAEEGEEVKRYPYDKAWEQAKDDPVVVLHSSGSTGPPKPIVVTNAAMATLDAHHLIADVGGKRDALRAGEGSTMFNPMPCFHAAGLMWNFFIAVYFDIHVVYPPVGEPLNVELVNRALDELQFDWMFLPPSIVEDVAREEAVLPKLSKLRYVVFSGGPLSQELGDVIAKHTRVVNLLGTTENAVPPYNFVPLEDDWNYILVPPEMKGVEMRARSNDDLVEMVIFRDPHTDAFHSTFHTFPSDAEYSTKDLFARHPTHPSLWQHRARADDVLVLSNGEKVVPAPMESQLAQCPRVAGVVVLGHARFETAALLELHPDARTKYAPHENLAAIAEFVDMANAVAPAHARLSRDRVLFTAPDKPMARAAKGTVIRKATLAAYAREIEELYAGRASVALTQALPLRVDGADSSETEAALQDLFGNLTGKTLDVDADFFAAAGLDSLQVLNAVRQLKAQLGGEGAPLAPSMVSLGLVYANPSVRKLARALRVAAKGQVGGRSADERAKAMRELYLQYAHDLPHCEDAPSSALQAAEPPLVHDGTISVVLTGSTGSLGTYILAALLARPAISHVYCLNRTAPAAASAKQTQLLQSRGLLSAPAEQLDPARVTFLQTDPEKELYGLPERAYRHLLRDADYIIHNQWAVDFNLALPSFAPHVRGVRHLVDLAARSRRRPPILFTSTIDTVRNWAARNPGGGAKVPERAVHDLEVPSHGGYGEGKYIGERLLEAAGEVSGVSSAVCRAGQIAGPVGEGGGVWNEREWFPTLVKTSLHLGALPHSIGSQDAADWVPVDVLAEVVVELMFSNLEQRGRERGGAFTQFNHLVNPRPSSYADVILPVLRNRLSAAKGKDVPVVPYKEWLRMLQDDAARPDADPKLNPGIKLLDFFEELGADVGAREKGEATGVRLDTRETVGRSATLKGLKPVGVEWVEKWLAGWGL